MTENHSRNRTLLVSSLILCLFLVGWALYTGQIWEDFLITLRQSQNAAEGRGLVFSPGERIHGFTSPINVLLPAAILSASPALTPEQVLTLYNVVALTSFLAGWVWLLGFLLREEGASGGWHWAPLTLAIGLNTKLIAFSMNGQEAAFTICFLALALVALWRDSPDAWKLLGVGWAGLMWTRPDSCIIVAALGGAAFFWSSLPKRARGLQLLKAGTLCAVLYGPWIAFTTWYYGTPVPHTVVAKALYTASVHGSPWFWAKSYAWRLWEVLPRAFTPTYAEVGGWPVWLHPVARTFALVACLYWLVAGRDRIARTASFVCCAWIAYQCYVDTTGRAFPWYFPAAGMLGAIVLWRLCRRVAGGKPHLAGSLMLPFLGLLGFGYFSSLEPTRLRQVYIEDGVRRELGLWLKEHVPVGERVFLEPIGYIGYYSGCALDDYPGLVSPRVVAALRKRPTGWAGLIATLRSDWLVLRSGELRHLQTQPSLLEHYEAVALMQTPPEFDQLRTAHPSYELNSDYRFHVLRRRKAGEASTQ